MPWQQLQRCQELQANFAMEENSAPLSGLSKTRARNSSLRICQQWLVAGSWHAIEHEAN
jgi:hypothetical protein